MATAGKRKEPAVISIALLTAAIEDEATLQAQNATALANSKHHHHHSSSSTNDNQHNQITRPPIQLSEALTLQLSFRNLLRIENLHLLKSLRKLQLDNNSISKIEGLDTLHNLEWLDLSFNKIKKIENLSGLTKLKDISLFNNEITTLEELHHLPSLQCISLGNNLITTMDSILYFRQCSSLEALTLEGNPLCRPPEGSGANARDAYRIFCYAFLPKLKYLDYQLITASERGSARDGGVNAEQLQEVEEKDAQSEKQRKRETERKQLIDSLASANLEMIETLVDELFEDDSEWNKLRNLPGIAHLIQTFKENLVPAANDLRSFGMDKDKLIREEMKQFDEALSGIINDALNGTNQRLIEWEKAFKHATRNYKQALENFDHHHHQHHSLDLSHHNSAAIHEQMMHDPAIQENTKVLHTLRQDIDGFESWSLRQEMTTHEAVEAMLDVYDTAMVELKSAKVANHEGYFRAAESFETVFSEGLSKLAERAVSDTASGHTPPDADDELVSLLNDKETLNSVVGQTHETRVARILKKETDMKQREDKRCGGAVLTARRTELDRNRARLLEIKSISNNCRSRVNDLLKTAGGKSDSHAHHFSKV